MTTMATCQVGTCPGEELPPRLKQLLQDSYVDHDGFILREHIISELDQIVVKWVQETANNKGLDTESCTTKGLGARVIPFGGHCHRIVLNGGDIDVICLVPQCMTGKDFFDKLAPLLQKNPKVTKLRVVRGARVPIISLVYQSIEVDLCLCVMNRASIPDTVDLLSADVLRDMDPTSCRSLNGIMGTKKIQNLVPDYQRFTVVLKIIKLWAVAQGLHNTTMGYLGGLAWSILAARVCQLYPSATISALITAFFDVFSKWEWPKPVLLVPLCGKDPFNLKPWNPLLTRGDTFHLMPIIQPCYPEVNCATVVTASTRTLIMRALRKASTLLQQELLDNDDAVSKLLAPFPFFNSYKHFLQVSVHTNNQQDLLDWGGLVEARIRLLMTRLESQPSIQWLHTWAKAFPGPGEGNCSWLTGIQLTKGQPVHLNISESVQLWQEELVARSQQVQLYRLGMAVCVQHVRRKDLVNVVPPEVLNTMCTVTSK